MARYLEFVKGSSAKFWQVEVIDDETHVAYGKIGTPGVTQVKSWADEDGACVGAGIHG